MRIGHAQFATLFRIADGVKRGLLSWDNFVVFQTLLKRPDADYYIAFQYFDMYARASPCSAHMTGMANVCCV
jgi:solute carrier family 25 (mitochondrial aspartate/glutamate transporter), member 12/13